MTTKLNPQRLQEILPLFTPDPHCGQCLDGRVMIHTRPRNRNPMTHRMTITVTPMAVPALDASWHNRVLSSPEHCLLVSFDADTDPVINHASIKALNTRKIQVMTRNRGNHRRLICGACGYDMCTLPQEIPRREPPTARLLEPLGRDRILGRQKVSSADTPSCYKDGRSVPVRAARHR
jgi:hypothetical protein